MLGYLDQKLSFRPKTNAAVPDFDKLYQAFQQKAMETAERRDVTQCKPFQLRTSALQPRHRSPENPQVAIFMSRIDISGLVNFWRFL